jgi:hypothetical protein
MKISNLRPLSTGGRDTAPAGDSSIRGTDAQDLAVAAKPDRTRQKLIAAAAGAIALILVFGLLIRGWSATEHTVSRERLRIATVTEGPFVRDEWQDFVRQCVEFDPDDRPDSALTFADRLEELAGGGGLERELPLPAGPGTLRKDVDVLGAGQPAWIVRDAR